MNVGSLGESVTMNGVETAKMTRAELVRQLARAAAEPGNTAAWRPLQLVERAVELREQLLRGEVSAQEAADRWTEAQRAWPTIQVHVLGFRLFRWRRRIRPIAVVADR